MLFGREEARARVDDLLLSVRQGRGDSLLIAGPAGIGKTAMLQYAADSAEQLQVLWAKAVPAETAISYSGLSQILTPLLGYLPSLSAPQSAAVAGALAIGPFAGGDVFPLYAGTLHLLAAAAAKTPVVVLVDDLHWLDVASLNALQFALRRLKHDPVLFLMSFRRDPGAAAPADMPTLELPGLEGSAAAALLEEHGYPVDRKLVEWLVKTTGGNPLALQDLPTYVTPERLEDYVVRSRPAPVGPALTVAYGHAAATLPGDAQRAVLIAAMLDDSELPVVTRALSFCGLTPEALEPGEDLGLLSLTGGVIRMRHPLVRSAVHQIASSSALRAAHRAAAEGLLASSRPHHHEARVWHLAEAAVGLDEPTAELLEDLADAAKARAGFASASLTYQKAAELSARGENRFHRLLAAAEAACTAGLGAECARLLDKAEEEGKHSPRSLAEVALQRGKLTTWSGDPLGAARELEFHAERILKADAALSMKLSVDAAVAAILSGDMVRAMQAAKLSHRIATELGPAAIPFAELIVGAVQALRGDGNLSRQLLNKSRSAFDIVDPPLEMLEQLVHLATAYSFIDSFEEAVPLYKRAIAMARRHGAIGLLPFALVQSAVVDFRVGAWEAASVGASEALSLAEDCGRTTERSIILVVLAMIDAGRGREQGRARALAAISQASAMGTAVIEAQGYSMLGLLELSIGRPAAALEPLQHCGRLATRLGLLEFGHVQWAPELIEAHVRAGTTAEIGPTLMLMRQCTRSSATTLDHALLARCEGLAATDGAWEDAFRAALELHQSPGSRPFETARTELCFGERLRRNRRRKDARVHLSAAWEKFSALGATSWAQRASNELVATGTTMPGATRHVSDLLTPQELQVALAVADGATNRQVANALFLSQKTVEFHLSGAFRRLGVRSRGDLARTLHDRRVKLASG
jgi:DNA-binding CsgD family transcriptional regulator/tetratricopeptide (TPR) repeat protein